MNFMISCSVDEQRRELRAELKPAHLAYVSGYLDRVIYAGVVEDAGESLKRVVYFIELDSEASARAFAQGDPYQPIYRDVEVVEFRPRIDRASAMSSLRTP